METYRGKNPKAWFETLGGKLEGRVMKEGILQIYPQKNAFLSATEKGGGITKGPQWKCCRILKVSSSSIPGTCYRAHLTRVGLKKTCISHIVLIGAFFLGVKPLYFEFLD